MQLVSAFPNPFIENINLLINNRQQGFVQITAYNSLGALIYSSALHSVNEGTSTIMYDLRNLPSGLYLFKVLNYDANQTPVNQYSFKSIKTN